MWLLLSLERGCLDRTLDRRQLSRALERGLERGLDMWLLSRLWKGVLIGPTLDRGGRSCSERDASGDAELGCGPRGSTTARGGSTMRSPLYSLHE